MRGSIPMKDQNKTTSTENSAKEVVRNTQNTTDSTREDENHRQNTNGSTKEVETNTKNTKDSTKEDDNHRKDTSGSAKKSKNNTSTEVKHKSHLLSQLRVLQNKYFMTFCFLTMMSITGRPFGQNIFANNG